MADDVVNNRRDGCPPHADAGTAASPQAPVTAPACAGADPRAGANPRNCRLRPVPDADLKGWLDWLDRDPSFDRARRSLGKKLVMEGLIDDPR